MSVVGSRQSSGVAIAFTEAVARSIVRTGAAVVSGGARGIDQIALKTALDEGGTAVAFLPGDLGRAITQRTWREAIDDDRALLMSSVHPVAGFTVGNAMARNKLIYCSSDATCVVSSSLETGGTWAGATENLRNAGVPLFVREVSDDEHTAAEGNTALISRGCIAMTAQTVEKSNWWRAEPVFDQKLAAPRTITQLDLFA